MLNLYHIDTHFPCDGTQECFTHLVNAACKLYVQEYLGALWSILFASNATLRKGIPLNVVVVVVEPESSSNIIIVSWIL